METSSESNIDNLDFPSKNAEEKMSPTLNETNTSIESVEASSYDSPLKPSQEPESSPYRSSLQFNSRSAATSECNCEDSWLSNNFLNFRSNFLDLLHELRIKRISESENADKFSKVLSEKHAMEFKLDEAMSKVDSLQKANADLNISLKEENSDQILSLQTENSKLLKSMECNEAEMVHLKQSVRTLQINKHSLETNLREQTLKLDLQKNEDDKLQSQITDFQRQHDSVQEEMTNVQERIKNLSENIAFACDINKKLQKVIQCQAGELKNKEEVLENYKKQIFDLEQKLNIKPSEELDYTQKRELSLSNSENSIKQMQTELNLATESNQCLRREIEELKSASTLANEISLQSSKNFDALNDTLTDLASQLSAVQSEKSDLLLKYNECTDKIRKLTKITQDGTTQWNDDGSLLTHACCQAEAVLCDASAQTDLQTSESRGCQMVFAEDGRVRQTGVQTESDCGHHFGTQTDHTASDTTTLHTQTELTTRETAVQTDTAPLIQETSISQSTYDEGHSNTSHDVTECSKGPSLNELTCTYNTCSSSTYTQTPHQHHIAESYNTDHCVPDEELTQPFTPRDVCQPSDSDQIGSKTYEDKSLSYPYKQTSSNISSIMSLNQQTSKQPLYQHQNKHNLKRSSFPPAQLHNQMSKDHNGKKPLFMYEQTLRRKLVNSIPDSPDICILQDKHQKPKDGENISQFSETRISASVCHPPPPHSITATSRDLYRKKNEYDLHFPNPQPDSKKTVKVTEKQKTSDTTTKPRRRSLIRPGNLLLSEKDLNDAKSKKIKTVHFSEDLSSRIYEYDSQ